MRRAALIENLLSRPTNVRLSPRDVLVEIDLLDHPFVANNLPQSSPKLTPDIKYHLLLRFLRESLAIIALKTDRKISYTSRGIE